MRFKRSSAGKVVRTGRVTPPKYSGYASGAEVIIEVGVNKCQFLSAYPHVVEQALTTPYPGYYFSPQYQRGDWDGKKHFITRNGYFPTGLLPLVYHILKTGYAPAIEKGGRRKKVLDKPIENVVLKVKEEIKKDFYPGILNAWENPDLLEYLNPETGVFEYPTKQLNIWNRVKDSNPLAKPILNLCRSLLP